MAKAISTLDWCIVRLGDDHNWWVAETSDPVRWDVDGLSIVDPRQALARERIGAVLQQLSQEYDFIIVDSAPVLPVADAQLIGQHVDGVVFSVMRDVSRLRSGQLWSAELEAMIRNADVFQTS